MTNSGAQFKSSPFSVLLASVVTDCCAFNAEIAVQHKLQAVQEQAHNGVVYVVQGSLPATDQCQFDTARWPIFQTVPLCSHVRRFRAAPRSTLQCSRFDDNQPTSTDGGPVVRTFGPYVQYCTKNEKMQNKIK